MYSLIFKTKTSHLIRQNGVCQDAGISAEIISVFVVSTQVRETDSSEKDGGSES